MRLTAKTKALWLLALLLAGITMLPERVDPSLAPLPELPALEASEANRIEITHGALPKVVLQRQDTGWTILQPIQSPADNLLVGTLLRGFEEATPMDVRVDDGELETYGLDIEKRILVEIFAQSETPQISFSMGANARGGAAFLRLTGSEAVYRSRVGARHRFEMDAVGWRDKMVLQLEADNLVAMSIERQADRLEFLRNPTGDMSASGELELGAWSLVDQDFVGDPRLIELLVKSLSTIRASEILSPEFDGGFETPAAVVTLRGQAGEEHRLTIGNRAGDGSAFVTREGREGVFRVAENKRQRAQLPVSSFRSLQVLQFSLTEATSISLLDDRGPYTLSRPQGQQIWNVTEPVNVDADHRQIALGLTQLSSLRAEALSPATAAEAGLEEPSSRFTIHFDDQPDQVLLLGRMTGSERGQALYYASVEGVDQTYLLAAPRVLEIRAAFGRGQ